MLLRYIKLQATIEVAKLELQRNQKRKNNNLANSKPTQIQQMIIYPILRVYKTLCNKIM